MMPAVTGTKQMDFKKKYKTLKRKLKFLLYEQECFLEELRKAQRKLLKVSRDRSFLLDRLMQYEQADDSSSESADTASSDSEGEGAKREGGPPNAKRKKMAPTGAPVVLGESTALLPGMGLGAMMATQPPAVRIPPMMKPGESSGKKPKPTKKKISTPKAVAGKVTKAKARVMIGGHTVAGPHHQGVGQMTREELERHLEIKQSARPQFMSIEKTPYALPDDIFSNDNSNDREGGNILIKEETEDGQDLVIDLPQ